MYIIYMHINILCMSICVCFCWSFNCNIKHNLHQKHSAEYFWAKNLLITLIDCLAKKIWDCWKQLRQILMLIKNKSHFCRCKSIGIADFKPAFWAVEMVKWLAYVSSIPMIWVRIQLASSSCCSDLLYKKNKSKGKRLGMVN